MRAIDIGRHHIGATVTAHPRTTDGTEPVTGILRWITWTSDHVVLALEDGEDAGAVEWTLHPGDEVTIR